MLKIAYGEVIAEKVVFHGAKFTKYKRLVRKKVELFLTDVEIKDNENPPFVGRFFYFIHVDKKTIPLLGGKEYRFTGRVKILRVACMATGKGWETIGLTEEYI